MGIEKVVLLFPKVGGTAVPVIFSHPLPFDSAIEALDRLVEGDEIVTALLTDPAELGGVCRFDEGRGTDTENGEGRDQGNPSFHKRFVVSLAL